MIEVITDVEKLKVMSEDVVIEDNEQIVDIIHQLKEYLKENENSFAISAPQLGFNKKIFCVRTEDDSILTFINPGIKLNNDLVIDSEKFTTVCEQNDSYPGKQFINFRASKIIVRYLNEQLILVESELNDELAFIYQQMMDMVNGISPTVLGLELPEGYDDLSEEEKQECIEIYLNYVLNIKEQLDKEIDSDEDSKLRRDALRFTSAVLKGEIETENSEKKILEKYASKKSRKGRR